MSLKKSFMFKMVFALSLLLMLNIIPPTVTFADGNDSVTDCLNNQEKCLNNSGGADQNDAASAPMNKIGIFDYIKVLFALGLVIGLLILVLRFLNKKNAVYQQNSLMKNLGGISVGQQKSVQLLQIGNRLYIVGVGENISLIKEIEDQEEMNQVLEFYNDRQQDSSTVPFLTEILSKLKPEKNVQYEQSTPFNELFNAKLKTIKKERSQELEGWIEKEKDRHE